VVVKLRNAGIYLSRADGSRWQARAHERATSHASSASDLRRPCSGAGGLIGCQTSRERSRGPRAWRDASAAADPSDRTVKIVGGSSRCPPIELPCILLASAQGADGAARAVPLPSSRSRSKGRALTSRRPLIYMDTRRGQPAAHCALMMCSTQSDRERPRSASDG
jgi:hypothetical protein